MVVVVFIVKFSPIIYILSCLKSLAISFISLVIFVVSVSTLFTCTCLRTRLVMHKTRTIFLKAMWFFAWTVDKWIVSSLYGKLRRFLGIQKKILSSTDRSWWMIIFLHFYFHFSLFSQQKATNIILTALTLTYIWITFSSLTETCTVEFKTFYRFT